MLKWSKIFFVAEYIMHWKKKHSIKAKVFIETEKVIHDK